LIINCAIEQGGDKNRMGERERRERNERERERE
jgi:hypothetical protein